MASKHTICTALAEGLPKAPLSRDDRDGVRFLQQVLIETGHMVAGAIRFASGIYGKFTSGAVADIQTSLRVPRTGEYDNFVREQLLKDLNAHALRASPSSSDSHLPSVAARIDPPSDCHACLNYTSRDAPEGAPVPLQTLIRDARPLQQDGTLSLDTNGFALVQHESVLSKEEFYRGRGLIESIYFQETEALIQQELGADKVFAFASQLRNSGKVAEYNPQELNPFEERTPRSEQTGGHGNAPVQVSSYATKVHTDFTGSKSAEKFYRTAIPNGVKARYVLINAWRNISEEPVYNHSLACLDTTSITNEELVRVNEQLKPGGLCNFRDGMTTTDCAEQYRLPPERAAEHRWFYYPHMKKDEVLLFKQFDSDQARTSRFTFHSAFNDASIPANLPTRESVEVRAIAIFIEEEDPSVKANVLQELAFHRQPAYTLQGRLAARAARGLLAPADVERLADLAALQSIPDDTLLQRLRDEVANRGGSNTQKLPKSRLAHGAYSEEVRQLQLVLVELGVLDYSAIKYNDTRSFSDTTAAGVATIQRALGKVATGVYDESVRLQLQTMLEGGTAASA